uniref:Spermidine synthase n=1 Tax=Cacopsylla melanoneura TaxID=428564 RepID=A0A8D8T313_9HEMI
MDSLQKGWFSELSPLWPGVSLSLEVEEVLHSEQSEYQKINVLKTKEFGTALILDGVIQCTEFDEFAYSEMIAFLPLCSHPDPKSVLIVGGGDGGVVREVLKHPSVQSAYLVEIDARVMEVSRQYLPNMAVGLNHPRLKVHVGDGFKFMQEHEKEFDVIITDSSDPVGPAESLFQASYFDLMSRALRPGGIVCSQAGTLWYSLQCVSSTLQHCRSVFKSSAYAAASVPTYPSGQIGFVLGSLNKDTNFQTPLRTFSPSELETMKLRYYSKEIHTAAFTLPFFAREALSKVS